MLYYIALYCILLYYIVLHCSISYYIVLSCIILYYIALHCINIVLYYIILYYIVLHYIILWSRKTGPFHNQIYSRSASQNRTIPQPHGLELTWWRPSGSPCACSVCVAISFGCGTGRPEGGRLPLVVEWAVWWWNGPSGCGMVPSL